MILVPQQFGLPAVAAAFAGGLLAGAAVASGYGARPFTAPATAAPVVADAAQPRYPVEVVRVIDGDTFEARVHVWPGVAISTKVRLRNIDAPEMRGRCEQERAQARAARDALAAMLDRGRVSIARVGLDKYGGRVLAEAATDQIGDVSAALLETGLVRRYAGGRRESWCLYSQGR